MITPVTFNGLEIFAGDVFDLALNWKDDAGTLFDLTDYHARLQFFKTKSERAVIDTLTDGDGITLGDGSAEPNIAAHIDDSETTYTTIPHYYVLELQEPSSDWQRLLEGALNYHR